MNKAKKIPEGYHSLTAGLVAKDAIQAIEFYKKAFGAEELYRMMMPDGVKVAHAVLKFGDSLLMVNDEMPGGELRGGDASSRPPIGFYLYVDDVDLVFKQVINAGGKEQMAIEDQFWGDRCGSITDPFGVHWMIATHQEDLSDKEIEERGRQFMQKKKKAA